MKEELKINVVQEILNLGYVKDGENPEKQNLYNLINESDNSLKVGEEFKNRIWYEPEQFYSEFRKIIYSNIESEEDKEEILNYISQGMFFIDLPKYLMTEKGLDMIVENKYKPTISILKRLYYVKKYAIDALLSKRKEQMEMIGSELELLIRKDLQKKSSLDEHMKKVLEETE